MEIKLIAATPNAKRVAFASIRTCYSPDKIDKIFFEDFNRYESKKIPLSYNQPDGKLRIDYISDADRLLRQISESGHTSVFEHVTFTFSIEGISRACLAQLTRHRIASYSVQSQRYVKQNTDSKHGGVEFTLPQISYLSKEKKNNAAQLLNDTTKIIQNAYDQLVSYGVKAEDARAILPQCSCCNLIMTMNLRSLLNFYKLRNQNTHAQAEIQEVAETIRALVVAQEPWTNWFFSQQTEEKCIK